MADTATLQIDSETVERLQRIAAETGESVEQAARRILADATIDLTEPYPHVDETLDERLDNPGPFASPERAEAVLSRFRSKG